MNINKTAVQYLSCPDYVKGKIEEYEKAANTCLNKKKGKTIYIFLKDKSNFRQSVLDCQKKIIKSYKNFN